MTSSFLYAIQSIAKGQKGQPLYLNGDVFGNVTVQYSIATSSQWSIYYVPSMAAVMFVNDQNGRVLTASADNHTVTTEPYDQPSGHNTWTYSSKDPGAAIRPLYNDAENLNVSGDSYPAGTPVILYKWDGAANSKWDSVAQAGQSTAAGR